MQDVELLAADGYDREQMRAVSKALRLAPNIDVFRALLDGQDVPVDALDQRWRGGTACEHRPRHPPRRGPRRPHHADVPDPEPHTWQPANLIQLAANPPEPPTIGGLLYPGKRTVLSGETESMKTWLALILCKAELDIGLPVCWVDLDAMGPGAMLERLQLLGVTDEQIGDFLYYEPSGQLTATPKTDLTATIAARGIRLCVIDAFNPILGLHGLDPNSVPTSRQFWTHIADPICRAGAAPVLLDHVVKNADNRGKYSAGSERKASGAIVHLGFKLARDF
jgi:hypothetical protein